MHKSLAVITAAVAMLSLALLPSDRAQAGSATSAASKYDNAAQSANLNRVRNHRLVQTTDFPITEFSSSSARSSVPKR